MKFLEEIVIDMGNESNVIDMGELKSAKVKEIGNMLDFTDPMRDQEFLASSLFTSDSMIFALVVYFTLRIHTILQ